MGGVDVWSKYTIVLNRDIFLIRYVEKFKEWRLVEKLNVIGGKNGHLIGTRVVYDGLLEMTGEINGVLSEAVILMLENKVAFYDKRQANLEVEALNRKKQNAR